MGILLSNDRDEAFFKIFLMLIFDYFWETERERERERGRDKAWVEEGKRERETQNVKQALGSELLAQSLTQGSNSGTLRSWPESKLDTQPTEPPRHPRNEAFNTHNNMGVF